MYAIFRSSRYLQGLYTHWEEEEEEEIEQVSGLSSEVITLLYSYITLL